VRVPTASRVWVPLAVAAGGALGTVARYELALAEPVGSGRFPWATFVVNLVGSFVLGVALTVVLEPGAAAAVLRPFLAVGFCGGLTTFSTWMVESVLLVRAGDTGVAVVYLLVSLAAGLAAVGAGVALGRRVLPTAPAVAFDPEQDD
jgi:CrcB protein